VFEISPRRNKGAKISILAIFFLSVKIFFPCIAQSKASSIPSPPSIGDPTGPPPTGVFHTDEPFPFSVGFGWEKERTGNKASRQQLLWI